MSRLRLSAFLLLVVLFLTACPSGSGARDPETDTIPSFQDSAGDTTRQ